MHYRLTNACASFQRFMNDTKDLLGMCFCLLYDVLIYFESTSERKKHVLEVLRRLSEHNLFEKCEFKVDTTGFLRFVISPDGTRMNESKVKIIQDWPTPRRVKDVQSLRLADL